MKTDSARASGVEEERLRTEDRELLERVRAAGDTGYRMSYGETGSTMRLTEAGLVRWEQTNPFVATVWSATQPHRGTGGNVDGA